MFSPRTCMRHRFLLSSLPDLGFNFVSFQQPDIQLRRGSHPWRDCPSAVLRGDYVGSCGRGSVLEDRYRGVSAAPQLAVGVGGRVPFLMPFLLLSPGSPSGRQPPAGAAKAVTALWTPGRSC